MRSLEVVTQLIEVYPPTFRRWCDAPENGGCACMGCVRWPAPSTVCGDPEGKRFPNPDDRLTKEEVELYLSANPKPKPLWELAWEKEYGLGDKYAKDELREGRLWERAGYKQGYLTGSGTSPNVLELRVRDGGANIPPEQIPYAIKVWCNAHSAKLARINKALNDRQPTREDYTGYDQDLFEYYGCRTFEV